MSNIIPPEKSYLETLTNKTPWSFRKLIAAWDGLSTEDQIIVLEKIDYLRYPYSYTIELVQKSIQSSNDYVRYLSAKCFDGVFYGEDDPYFRDAERIKNKIEEDSCELVSYAGHEGEWSLLHRVDPEEFFGLSQNGRLAKVRNASGGGEAVARLVSYAIKTLLNKTKEVDASLYGVKKEEEIVTDFQLYEILVEYLSSKKFKDRYFKRDGGYDGFGEYSGGKDMEAMWRLAPDAPTLTAYALISLLPGKSGFMDEIPRDVLENLKDDQLTKIFYREDIYLSSLREKIFRSDKWSQSVRVAAASSNFTFDTDSFQEILDLPKKERNALLSDLGSMCRDLSLVYFDALHDLIFMTDHWELANSPAIQLKKKVSQLSSDGSCRDVYQSQLRELRLYRLARQVVPWKSGEKGVRIFEDSPLAFLRDSEVKGDTWGTFKNFKSKYYEKKHLDRYLPSVWEAGIEQEYEESSYNDEQMELKTQFDYEGLIHDLQESNEISQSRIVEAIRGLSEGNQTTRNELIETSRLMSAEMAKGKALTYLIIFLLIILVFK